MSVNNTLATAVLAGLLSAGGIMTYATIAHAASNDQVVEKQVAANDQVLEKHACKGLNSCKGKGADGKNECKGQGTCRTDGQ